MPSRSSFMPTLITSIIMVASLVAVTLIARVIVTHPAVLPSSPTLAIPPSPTTTPTATATPLPTPTPTNTPTPTPTPVQVSLPYVGPAGQLAYVQSGRLTIVGPDGSATVVAETGVPHEFRPVDWSPDGHRLLYLTERNARWEYHVWENPTGQTLHLDQDVPGFPPEGDGFSGRAWSPDGERLLFWAWQPDESGVWVVDVEARSLSRVADGFRIVRATWVDTSTILYQEHHGTWTERLRLVSIANPLEPLTDTLDGEWASGLYSLSPDRRYLAGIEWSDEPNRRLWVAPLPGHPPLTLPAQPTATAPLASAPLWSPDGRWIAYGAQAAADPANDQVYGVVVDTTGVSPTRVIPGLFPRAWSPDSRMLAGPTCQSFNCGLAVTGVFTDRVTTIAADGQVHLWHLAWSPQGVHLAYSLTGPDADPGGLVLWDRSTGERRLWMAGSEAAPFTDLQWSPDGCHLYFAQRKGFVEGPASVEALWSVGPTWDYHWRVAPLNPADPDDGPLPCPPSPLEGRRLISFYGSPAGPGLGILGRYDISATLELLSEQIQAYRELDQAAGTQVETIPGFHMITTVADDFAGGDADYNHRVEHDTIRPWIDGIRAAGGWSVLDVQPGHADLKTELDLIEPFLWEPDVHLAVDPEFMMSADQVPGLALGQISGQQINYAQARLEQIARATGQRKLLVIHQFEDEMIGNKDEIMHYPLVDLIWDCDGFGGPWPKIADYAQYSGETGFEYGGFKIFYDYDTPVMTPEQVLELDPPAALVIYQ